MGHASKFVVPGSVRIGWTMSGQQPEAADLQTASFLTPDDTRVVIVMNNGTAATNYTIAWNGQYATVPSPPHSIQTLTF